MTTIDGRFRYGRVAVSLHWTIAALILANLWIGYDFPAPVPGVRYAPKPLLPLHVSIGLLVLLLSIARLAWRLTHRPPPYRHPLPHRELVLAHAAHGAFYVLIIAMPLTGWLTLSAHKVHRNWLSMFGLPWPQVPGFTALPAATVDRLHDQLVDVHGVLTLWLLPALLGLHVGAVLKHHLFDRAPVLGRMWPGTRQGRETT